MKPDSFSALLLARRWLTENSVELRLERPSGFDFKPGQYIRLLHQSLERDYSLASGPDDPELRLVVRVFTQGTVSTFLSTVADGMRMSFYGPMGYFVFQASDRTPVFVATGTGVAPFVAMSRAGIKKYVCLHGAKDVRGLLYRKELENGAARYVPCLTETTAPDDSVFSGRVTAYFEHLDTGRAYDFYLCGHQDMIHDAFGIIDDRFAESHIHSEVFY